jgi:predicted dehydrogenase
MDKNVHERLESGKYMKAKANLALIGVGGISQSQHLPNMKRADHVNLITICDLREDVLKKMQIKYNVPSATTDYNQILNDSGIDGVVIATKAESHVPLTLQALKAGKHVYVEKPLADTSEECKDVLGLQKETGKIVAVGFNRRLAPSMVKVKEILSKVGGAKHIHYRISDAYWIWGKGNPPGQRVVHEVCHIFDLLRYITDSEVKSVYCAKARDDDETIVLQFENDSVASIMSSGYGNYDLPKESLEIITDVGAIIVNEFVELNTFGIEGYEPSYFFSGHIHPDRDLLHKYIFEKMGFEALVKIRRIYYENQIKLKELRQNQQDNITRKELELYEQQCALANYMVDKGWIGALEHFSECIVDNNMSCNLATPADGWKVALIAEAAIKSRETNQVIFLD